MDRFRETGSYNAVAFDPIAGAKIVFEAAGIKDNQLALALDKVYRTYTGTSALEAITQEPSQAESIDAGTWPENEPEIEQGANTEPTENEPEPLKATKSKGGRPKGEKRVQVSVYLRQETYEALCQMSDIVGTSIGETAAQILDKVAKKNRANIQATAETISKARQGFDTENPV